MASSSSASRLPTAPIDSPARGEARVRAAPAPGLATERPRLPPRSRRSVRRLRAAAVTATTISAATVGRAGRARRAAFGVDRGDRPPRRRLPLVARGARRRRGGMGLDGATSARRRVLDVLLGPGIRRHSQRSSDRAPLRAVRYQHPRACDRSRRAHGVAAVLVWRIGRRTSAIRRSASAVLLWVWPPYLVWKSERAHGFYGSGLVLVCLVLLLVLRLAERRSRARRQRSSGS